MSSQSDDRSWHNRGGKPERVFLVGVEFLSRGVGGREPRKPSADGRSADSDTEAVSNDRRQPAGKVPPVARAARSVAGARLHATEIEHRAFSAGESMAELRELAGSAGATIAGERQQRRQRPDSATLIGSGKVEEMKGAVASGDPELVIFDYELTPSQQRNLERELQVRVIDRTQLILDIFARHARTREGQLQVELAQLEYLLPRLVGRGKTMSQTGGGSAPRGPGETQLETDRRRIQRRIDQLKSEVDAVRRVRRQQRQRREAVPVPTVALVGYTNAGKSPLFNRITGGHVLESSRMFATLDPKLRAIELPSRRKVLLSDTVGFIRNLPHTLVTSFRATLEEVEQAEVLLHVRDAASSYGEEQKAQVEKVLGELEALNKPRIEVMNKIDLLGATERDGLEARAAGNPEVPVSARTGEGIERLLAAIDGALQS